MNVPNTIVRNGSGCGSLTRRSVLDRFATSASNPYVPPKVVAKMSTFSLASIAHSSPNRHARMLQLFAVCFCNARLFVHHRSGPRGSCADSSLVLHAEIRNSAFNPVLQPRVACASPGVPATSRSLATRLDATSFTQGCFDFRSRMGRSGTWPVAKCNNTSAKRAATSSTPHCARDAASFNASQSARRKPHTSRWKTRLFGSGVFNFMFRPRSHNDSHERLSGVEIVSLAGGKVSPTHGGPPRAASTSHLGPRCKLYSGGVESVAPCTGLRLSSRLSCVEEANDTAEATDRNLRLGHQSRQPVAVWIWDPFATNKWTLSKLGGKQLAAANDRANAPDWAPSFPSTISTCALSPGTIDFWQSFGVHLLAAPAIRTDGIQRAHALTLVLTPAAANSNNDGLAR